jgi:hypothetical protein
MNGRPQALRFERVRSFGRIMSDTRNFVRENFVVFFKTILFIAGPFVLLTCALQVYYQVNLVAPGEEYPSMNKLGSYLAMTQIYSQSRWVLNGFVIAIVTSHFIKVYREKGPGKFDTGDVSRSILRDIAGNLLAFIVLFFSVALIAFVLGYFVYGLANVSIGAAIGIFIAAWLAYLLLRFPFWYFVFSVFFARTSAQKPLNVFSAMGLAGRVFSGNWWITWVNFFVMWIILYMLGAAVSFPAQIAGSLAQLFALDINEESTDWRLITTVLMTLGEFAKTVINSVFCITVALHFYSLKEKNDGEGTKKLVDSIGTKNEDEGIELTW